MKIPENFKPHNTTLSSDCGHWYIYHYSLGIWKRRDKSVSTTELWREECFIIHCKSIFPARYI